MTLGTASWNPSSRLLKGSAVISLKKGNHQIYLQWMKDGDSFSSWGSNPSYLDGFASTRNFYVLKPKIPPSILHSSHERSIIARKNAGWHNIGGKTLSLQLIKECAVLIKYLLPVSQIGNTNFDANVWSSLATVRSRILVDNIPYSLCSEVSSTSRVTDVISGELGLILSSGSHSIILQWEANSQTDWALLNTLDNGFTNSESLLVLVSSENSFPTIACPDVYHGYENIDTMLSGISVGDLDIDLLPGISLQLNISVTVGMIVSTVPIDLQRFMEVTLLSTGMMMTIETTVSIINIILQSLTYRLQTFAYGIDVLTLVLSDLGGVGGGHVLFANKSVTIEVAHIGTTCY